MKIPVEFVLPNPDQPRTVFDQAELEGLAQSIKENGLIQPIVVEQAEDRYILIGGERRWRAHQMLGLKRIEAVISKIATKDRLVKALVENVQRSAMGAMDEAKAYQKVVEQERGVKAAAEKIGVSEAIIYMRLNLLNMPEVVQKLFNLKRLPLSQNVVSALQRLKPDEMSRVATIAATRGWSAQSICRMVKERQKGRKAYVPKKKKKNAYVPVGDHFNALAMVVEHKRLSKQVVSVSESTCKACSLYSEASPAICNQCPMVEFLNKLAGAEMKK